MLPLLTLQISTNGLVSFQSPFSSFNPSSFPITPVPVIAPLWADFDFRETGTVYYRVSTDEATLARVSRMINDSNPDFHEFIPSLCAVVTWSEATLFANTLSKVIMTTIRLARELFKIH